MAKPLATPKEIRAARSWLFRHGATAQDIPPRKFANAAKELNMGFAELLRLISRLYSGGQGQAQFRQGAILAAAEAEKTG